MKSFLQTFDGFFVSWSWTNSNLQSNFDTSTWGCSFKSSLLLIFLSLTSIALRRNIMNQQEYDNLSISFISSLPSDIKLGQMNSDSKAANLHSIVGWGIWYLEDIGNYIVHIQKKGWKKSRRSINKKIGFRYLLKKEVNGLSLFPRPWN